MPRHRAEHRLPVGRHVVAAARENGEVDVLHSGHEPADPLPYGGRHAVRSPLDRRPRRGRWRARGRSRAALRRTGLDATTSGSSRRSRTGSLRNSVARLPASIGRSIPSGRASAAVATAAAITTRPAWALVPSAKERRKPSPTGSSLVTSRRSTSTPNRCAASANASTTPCGRSKKPFFAAEARAEHAVYPQIGHEARGLLAAQQPRRHAGVVLQRDVAAETLQRGWLVRHEEVAAGAEPGSTLGCKRSRSCE